MNPFIPLVVNLLMAIASKALKWLTISGAISAFVIGFIVMRFLGIGGWALLLLFFVTATVLGRLSRHVASEKTSSIQKKGGTRDWAQVLANGGLAAVSALLYGLGGGVIPIVMFGASLSASTADTWASEAGILSHRPPISILTGRPVPTGMSGGLSFLGTASSILGAIMIALAWYATFAGYTDPSWILLASVVAVSGVIGSFADSLLGATLQGHYYDPDREQVTEHETIDGKRFELCRGVRWIDNDVVNFLSNVIAVLIASGFSLILL